MNKDDHGDVEVQIPDDVKPGDRIEVTVDDDKPTKVEKKEEAKYVSVEDLQKIQADNEKLRKQVNGLSYSARQTEKLTKEILELKAIISDKSSSTKQKESAKDELDELMDKGEWKSAVEKLAEKKFEERMRLKEQEDSQKSFDAKQMEELEKSKKKVYQKYPELMPGQEDTESEVFKTFIKIRNENPELLKNVRGPELVMYQMEEILKSSKEDSSEKEELRRARVGATSVPRGAKPNVNGGKVILTKEQRDFCDHHNIKYEVYAKNLRNSKEGVET